MSRTGPDVRLGRKGVGKSPVDPGGSVSASSETAGPGEEAARLFLATLRIRIPSTLWTGRFTTAHPSVRLEVLNSGEVSSDVSVSDYWITGGTPGAWTEQIASFPDVIRVESLSQVGDGCLYRITYRNPPVVYLYRRLGLPLQFPLRMQAGVIQWEVAARYSDFQKILAHAREADPEAKVVSIRRRPLRDHLPVLTESQHLLLTEAMAAGYFAVPRGITLTALARKLNRSKSGLSESIAIIEKRLLESAFHPGPPA